MTIKNFKEILSRKFQGFTIIETFIAISIITVGLVGVLGLVSYTISISRISHTEIIAANLAQEGIEVIRNIRDSNWLADIADGPPDDSVSWREHIRGTGNERAGRVNYDTKGPLDQYFNPPPGIGNIINTCGSDCRLYLKDDFYSHDNTGEETNFYRLIRIQKVGPPPKRLKVKSIVAWEDRDGNRHQIRVEDHVYDYDQPSPSVKYKWELTDPLEVRDCNGGLEEEEGGACTIVAGGKYHHQHKCGKCCFNAACAVLGTDFSYIASWDINAYDFNPPLMSSPELPAFLGDPAEVCDIYENPVPPPDYKCRVFEKIEY